MSKFWFLKSKFKKKNQIFVKRLVQIRQNCLVIWSKWPKKVDFVSKFWFLKSKFKKSQIFVKRLVQIRQNFAVLGQNFKFFLMKYQNFGF